MEQWADRQAQQVHMGQPHMEALARLKDRYALDTAVVFYQL